MRWRSLPVFREKSPAYLDAVDAYLPALSALSVQQRRDLAVFKAAELLNALIQIRERRQAPDRLGDAFAKASFQRVRQVIRERRIVLQGAELIDLRDPVLRDLIDEGCRLFHAGKTDAAVYQRALALSAAQCLVLNDQLDEAIPSKGVPIRPEIPVRGVSLHVEGKKNRLSPTDQKPLVHDAQLGAAAAI